VNIYRKLQLSAAAVLVNGVVALASVAPASAQTGCGVLLLCNECPTLSYCNELKPGCTASSVTCTNGPLCPQPHGEGFCYYTT
jgi:hypothetical protein